MFGTLGHGGGIGAVAEVLHVGIGQAYSVE